MTDHCPACGGTIPGGRAGCQAVWDELFTQALNATASAPLPGAAFDAYCMQHPATYCVSAKSYAAHLTRLCCGVEQGGDPQVLAAIQKWLNGAVPLEKPPVLTTVGQLTIVDVQQAPLLNRPQVAQAWMQNVWEAYAPQHALARAWVQAAVGNARKR